MYKFCKIRWSPKEEKYEFEYEKLVNPEHNLWDELTLRSREKPKPSFITTMDALRPHLVELLELPEDFVSRVEVRSVTFGYAGDDGIMGATISGIMRGKKRSGVVAINTPYYASSSVSEMSTDENLLPSDCVEILKELIEEAEGYLEGEREQMNLFEGEKESTPEEKLQLFKQGKKKQKEAAAIEA